MRFDRELANGPCYTDVLRYQNIIEPESGAPIYMLFEIVEVKRKTGEDIAAERESITNKLDKMFRSQINYL